jgi:hypothetical protein
MSDPGEDGGGKSKNEKTKPICWLSRLDAAPRKLGSAGLGLKAEIRAYSLLT